LRILHVPGAVGGHPQGLARAERELGHDSRSLVFEASPFGYEADEVVVGLQPTLADRARLEAFRFRALGRVLAGRYDVVHFNFGQSLFPRPIVPGSPAVAGFPPLLQQAYRAWAAALGMRDLGIVRRRGVAVFVTFQGDDVRQADVARARDEWSPARESEPTDVERGMDRARRTVARRFDRAADGIYFLNPDLARVLPPRARFTPYAHVDPRSWSPRPHPPNSRPLVVHAPTARAIKGTHHVLEALDGLRREGIEFDLELVEGRTQAEAREIYARADLVIDQIMLGWYGGLAVESMAPTSGGPTSIACRRSSRVTSRSSTRRRRACAQSCAPGSANGAPSCRPWGGAGANSSNDGTTPGEWRRPSSATTAQPSPTALVA
jgi:hypothetical protein